VSGHRRWRFPTADRVDVHSQQGTCNLIRLGSGGGGDAADLDRREAKKRALAGHNGEFIGLYFLINT